MRNTKKIWLITATALTVVGLLLFVVAMSTLGWNFKKLDVAKYQTTTREITETFTDISVKTDTADILFRATEERETKVVCREQVRAKHTVSVQDGTLSIAIVDNREWYDHIGLGFNSPSITVYLPQKTYASLTVHASTGDVTVPQEFTFTTLHLVGSTGDVKLHASVEAQATIKLSTGDIEVKNASIGALSIAVTTGDVNLGHCTVGALNVQVRTGDVTFNAFDGGQITVKTTTGDVTGTLRSDMVFTARSNTGDVDVPKSTTGGKCEITTDTGDIVIRIRKD